MQRSELVRVVGDRTHVPEDVVSVVVNALFEEVARALDRGDAVSIRGFGTWRLSRLAGSTRPNPGTGIRVKYPPSRTVRWKPAVVFRDRLNQRLQVGDS